MATLIEIDGTTTEVEIPTGSGALETLQMYVGGYIEMIQVNVVRGTGNGPVAVDMYLNEDGKADGLPLNLLATSLARSAGIADDDYIVGPVVLCDPDEVR